MKARKAVMAVLIIFMIALLCAASATIAYRLCELKYESGDTVSALVSAIPSLAGAAVCAVMSLILWKKK